MLAKPSEGVKRSTGSSDSPGVSDERPSGLENARKNIQIGAYEVSAFLAHQAVEKYLKGAWLEKKRARPPATHCLRELGAGLRVPKRLQSHVNYLNPDYTVARYPDAANGVPYELYGEAIHPRSSRESAGSWEPSAWP